MSGSRIGERGRSRVALVVIVVMLGLLLFGTVPRILRNARLQASARASRQEMATVVVTRPRVQPDPGLTLPGSVEAIAQAIIQARTSGYVKRRRVDIGDRVRQGEVLAVIEAPEVDKTVDQARSDHARAVAVTTQAGSDLSRLQAGVGQARAQLAHAEAALAQARATWSSNRAKLYSARNNLAGREGDLKRARSNLVLAEKTWRRYKDLGHQGYVTEQDVDTQRTNFEANQALVNTAMSAVAQARADVDAAREVMRASEATVTACRADVESARMGLEASRAAVQTGVANVEAARAGRQSSWANVRRTEVLQGFEKVTAPFTGVITARNVDDGALVKADNIASGVIMDSAVAPQGGLFGIARTDLLRIKVGLPQSYVPFVKVGQKVKVALRELPDDGFEGVVARTAGALDPAARSLLVEVQMRNPQGKVLPGMYAEVTFTGDPRAFQLTIPGTAVLAGAEGTRVAVVDESGRVHIRPVMIRRDLGSVVEISKGLSVSERVVDNPSLDLAEGTRVLVVEAPASPAASGQPVSLPTGSPPAR